MKDEPISTPEPCAACLDPHGAAKPGLNAFGRRFMEILARAIDGATVGGVDRGLIASALGVSPHTVESWLKPSRTSMIPVDRFFELASREDILPDAARDALWADLGCEGGYVAVPEVHVGADGVAPIVHLAQIAVALGRLAEEIRSATAADGPEGTSISAAEARAMLAPVRDLERESVELRLSLEDLIARAGERASRREP